MKKPAMEPYGTKALQVEGTVAPRQEYFVIELTPGPVLLHHLLRLQALRGSYCVLGLLLSSVPRVLTMGWGLWVPFPEALWLNRI